MSAPAGIWSLLINSRCLNASESAPYFAHTGEICLSSLAT